MYARWEKEKMMKTNQNFPFENYEIKVMYKDITPTLSIIYRNAITSVPRPAVKLGINKICISESFRHEQSLNNLMILLLNVELVLN